MFAYLKGLTTIKTGCHINMQVELENAICQVLLQYFEKDASGHDTCPEIFHLQSDIDNYDPDFVEPPEEFFEEMMSEDEK